MGIPFILYIFSWQGEDDGWDMAGWLMLVLASWFWHVFFFLLSSWTRTSGDIQEEKRARHRAAGLSLAILPSAEGDPSFSCF